MDWKGRTGYSLLAIRSVRNCRLFGAEPTLTPQSQQPARNCWRCMNAPRHLPHKSSA